MLFPAQKEKFLGLDNSNISVLESSLDLLFLISSLHWKPWTTCRRETDGTGDEESLK